jgi:hypothetical protein
MASVLRSSPRISLPDSETPQPSSPCSHFWYLIGGQRTSTVNIQYSGRWPVDGGWASTNRKALYYRTCPNLNRQIPMWSIESKNAGTATVGCESLTLSIIIFFCIIVSYFRVHTKQPDTGRPHSGAGTIGRWTRNKNSRWHGKPPFVVNL